MSNPIKFIASHNGYQKFMLGNSLHWTELYLYCSDNIIVDEENYYTIKVDLKDSLNNIELEIVNQIINESIIWGEKEKILNYTKGYLDNFYEEGNLFLFPGFDRRIWFNIISTGNPMGLENSYWYLEQWKREIIF